MARASATLVVLACLLAPASAAAACSRADRADSVAAARTVVHLRQVGSPLASDAAAVLVRARRSCVDLRFARAVASASVRNGAPRPGQRLRIAGVPLRANATAAWRLDTVRAALDVLAARSTPQRDVLRARLRSASVGLGAVTWSDDPTSGGATWDADRQALVASVLARSSDGRDRALAAASVRALNAPRAAQLAARKLLDELRIANQFVLAADRSGDTRAQRVAHALAFRTFGRVRGAHVRGWSKLDGHWSTAAQHRLLVLQASALLARVPHGPTKVVVDALRGSLLTPPSVQFGTLPRAEFYPWPRDGAFDTQSVSFDVDKPSQLTLRLYAANATVVRAITVHADPGPVTLTWDGTGTDGATLGAGEYRYNIDASDPLANRVRVAGLEQFTVARDTVPPTVRSASVHSLGIGAQRRLVVSWDVEEVHSPQVHSWLVLAQGGVTKLVELHPTLQRATVRRPIVLGRGTWTTSFAFEDGSGNRTTRAAESIVVR
jgi:hypothetical protein